MVRRCRCGGDRARSVVVPGSGAVLDRNARGTAVVAMRSRSDQKAQVVGGRGCPLVGCATPASVSQKQHVPGPHHPVKLKVARFDEGRAVGYPVAGATHHQGAERE